MRCTNLFHAYFTFILHISVCKFECVSELSVICKEISIKVKKLTNTFKLIHRNGQNRNKKSNTGVDEYFYITVEGFHTKGRTKIFLAFFSIFFPLK
jgi:hypothetical protein